MNKMNLQFKKAKSKDEMKEMYGEYKMLKKQLKTIEQRHIDAILSS